VNFHKRVASFGLLILTTLFYIQPGSSQTPTTTTAPNPTGVKIGSIVSAAITTAFPAVSTILKAIWPSGKENDKQTKPTAQSKVEDAAAVAKRKAALEQFTKMGNELETVRIFLQASSDANEQVIAMQTLVQDKATIDDALKSQLGQSWILASGNLAQLKDDKIQARIDAMSDDSFVQTTLTNIRQVNLGRLEVVKLQIDGKQLAPLRKSLDDLQPKLSGISHLAGIIMGDIAVSLKTIPETITPSQGEQAPLDFVSDESVRASKDNEALKKLFKRQDQ
jgi:hypothetical protein